jgi:hypothetical protein
MKEPSGLRPRPPPTIVLGASGAGASGAARASEMSERIVRMVNIMAVMRGRGTGCVQRLTLEG